MLSAPVWENTPSSMMRMPSFSAAAQSSSKSAFEPEDGVYVEVIRRVVAVVGAGLEDGVQVDDADAEVPEVVEAAGDARRVPP